MTESKQDALARVYATLSSLQNRIDEMSDYSIREMYVVEFHSALDKLEGIGIDVSEFRIPDSLVKPRITGSTSMRGGGLVRSYSEDKYVERSFILTKLDAVLGYFEIITSDKPKEIGFHKPNRN